MPIIQFKVDKSSSGGDSYGPSPDIDLSASTTGSNSFVPDYYMIRSDANNAVEVVISFDGKQDGLQLPVVANQGGFYVKVDTHTRQVWVKRVGSGNAAAIALISAATEA